MTVPREVRRYPEHIKRFLDTQLPGWYDMPDEEFYGGLLALSAYSLLQGQNTAPVTGAGWPKTLVGAGAATVSKDDTIL